MNKIGISALIILCSVLVFSSPSHCQSILEPLYYDAPKILSQALDSNDLQTFAENEGIIIDEIGSYDPALNDSLQKEIARLHQQADSLNKEAKKLAELYKNKAKKLHKHDLDSLESDGNFFFRMNPDLWSSPEFNIEPFKGWEHHYVPPAKPELKGRITPPIPPGESQPFPAFPKWKVKWLNIRYQQS